MAASSQVEGEPIEIKPDFRFDYTEIPVDWTHAIQNHIEPEVSGELEDKCQSQKGVIIHEAIEEFFGDIDWLEFENEVKYMDGRDEWRVGTYDAFDGDFVYEFKTKAKQVFDRAEQYEGVLPKDDDMAQLNKYLAGTGSNWGILVYINRDSFDVQEFLIEREYIGFYEE